MAKQAGINKLKGTLGGINYYYSTNGGYLAREAGGGFSKKHRKKDTLVRTMENASEFGLCSTTKKYFRIALAPFLCVRKDGELHGRLVQLFTKLKSLDRVNRRGERRVARGLETPSGLYLLRNFVFTPLCNVMEVLAATGNFDFATRTFRVTNFDVKNVKFPPGATHMALAVGLLHFNFDTLEYELKNSVPLYIDPNYSASSFEMSVELPEVDGTAIAVVGMKFYQEMGGTYYLFRNANAVGLEVFGVVE